MLHICLYELKMNLKNLLIWSLTVGLLGFFCILLYSSMQSDMEEMAQSFSSMGAFADAFGMSTLSIATVKGYFATEIGTIHGLGSGLFAAILATCILSKEEDGHTGEFLYALPVSRGKVMTAKVFAVLANLIFFTAICACLYAAGFLAIGEEVPIKEFLHFMAAELMMNIEIAAVCLIISSFCRKNMLGAGLGVALVFYVYDLIGRVVPDMKDFLVAGPYSYANASEIFAGKEVEPAALVIGLAVIIGSIGLAYWRYLSRDLAS